MAIPPLGRASLLRTDFREENNRLTVSATSEEGEHQPVANLQEQISNAAEEFADVLSTFGRFSRMGRRNDSIEHDFLSSMLEEKADEKHDALIKQVSRLSLNRDGLLKYGRSLFPNDSDLMLALRELMLNRQLSALQKKRIKEAMADLEKFSDCPKMRSGINIGRLAKRFSSMEGQQSLSAGDLRDCYLRFLDLDLPGSFIYQDWIEQYGCHNRQRLLAFTMNALIADMKSSEPGIHFDEFGPLSDRLSDARTIHTLDLLLNEQFSTLPFRESLKNEIKIMDESDIVILYLNGIVASHQFEGSLYHFNHDFMQRLLLTQRATVIQILRGVYNKTPERMYIEPECRKYLLNFISSLLASFHDKERRQGPWSDYYT
ncbi:invasion protein [Candidatus Symbiopectobacterium sp. NZEC127]|uniref:HrpJ domain-containing protein n=1 Tax=Candidatus Symbiopectobacterium sp. NZEC127 TaxID=2820472 RepID=UPI0022269063|nr:HrpJ domain-containing protein [Candidatus Symbiopectobacterium sp. NZEC127]MCW2487407.1 invasion protein [Candidatus Symbiopectobacterium sp. NZEC127]